VGKGQDGGDQRVGSAERALISLLSGNAISLMGEKRRFSGEDEKGGSVLRAYQSLS